MSFQALNLAIQIRILGASPKTLYKKLCYIKCIKTQQNLSNTLPENQFTYPLQMRRKLFSFFIAVIGHVLAQ